MGKRTKVPSKVSPALQRAFEKSGLTFAQFAKEVVDRANKLAKKAGEPADQSVTPSTAHGWIKGTHGIKPKWLKPIAETLDIEVSELLA